MRNRIYDYTLDDGYDDFAPSVRIRASKSYKERIWQSIGLTQVCKGIRSEFRPLWIRNLCVRFGSYDIIDHFIEDFLHHSDGANSVPRLLQYSWEHGFNNRRPFDITSMLRMCSHSPGFQVEFVPAAVAEKRGIGDPCYSCRSLCSNRSRLGDDNEDNDCMCAHSRMDFRLWKSYRYDRIAYTSNIVLLCMHRNEA